MVFRSTTLVSVVVLCIFALPNVPGAAAADCPEPPPSPAFVCHSAGYWMTDGDLVVSNEIVIDSNVMIGGNLMFHPNATLIFNVETLIHVNQSASLAGKLVIYEKITIDNSERLSISQSLPVLIIESPRIEGDFSLIQLVNVTGCIEPSLSRTRERGALKWYEVILQRTCLSIFEVGLVVISCICGVIWLVVAMIFAIRRLRAFLNQPPAPARGSSGAA